TSKPSSNELGRSATTSSAADLRTTLTTPCFRPGSDRVRRTPLGLAFSEWNFIPPFLTHFHAAAHTIHETYEIVIEPVPTHVFPLVKHLHVPATTDRPGSTKRPDDFRVA